MFLGKYKMMLRTDCRLIYKTKDYRKRLKVLKREKYIKRVNSLYIKLCDIYSKIDTFDVCGGKVKKIEFIKEKRN